MPEFNDVPFNFVPLNEKVYIPEWGDEISQDIPFSDGEDGIISFDIENLTPLYIKNGVDRDKNNASSSAHVMEKDGKRLYFLPATSLKGMIRSVLEILSFSRLKQGQYNNDSFGFREIANTDYRKKMEHVYCGWLKRETGADGKDSYYIYECVRELDPIKTKGNPILAPLLEVFRQDELEQVFRKPRIGDIIAAFDKKGLGPYPQLSDNTCLVCTGHMNGKKAAYVFDMPEICRNRGVKVDKEVLDAFLTAYKPSPNYDFITQSLDELRDLAVFYKKENGRITSLGLSRMYRLPFKNNVKAGIRQQPACGRDLAECIFGYTDEEALRGRIQVGNAFGVILNDEAIKLELQAGVLGQPQASFYPYYLKSGNYDKESITIAGRKRYRVHRDDNISRMPEGNGNEKTITVLKLLPKGNRFHCDIRLHNMRPVEIGAILSALTFHDNSNCHHTIGMGKAMGYGKLKISGIRLNGFSQSDDLYYMKEFEKELASFCREAFHCQWKDTPAVETLCAIAADHTNTLAYMTLDEYGKYKGRKTPVASLTDPSIPVKSLLSDIEYRMLPYRKEETELRTGMAEIQHIHVADKKDKEELKLLIVQWEELRKRCEELISNIRPITNPELEEWKKILTKHIADVNQRIKDLETEESEQKEKKENERLREAGLRSFILENGAIPKTFPAIATRLKKWWELKQRTQLLAEEIPVLADSLREIYDQLKKKEQKNWDNVNKWAKLKEVLSETQVEELFQIVINKQ